MGADGDRRNVEISSDLAVRQLPAHQFEHLPFSAGQWGRLGELPPSGGTAFLSLDPPLEFR